MKQKIRKLLACLVAVIAVFSFTSLCYAEEDEAVVNTKDEETAASEDNGLTANLNVTMFSQYIWRGYELSKDSVVFFPSLTVGYKGFALNLWADLDTDYYSTGQFTLWETDLVLTYSNSVGPLDFTGGWIMYDVDQAPGTDIPEGGQGGVDNQEVFLILGFDTLLSPEFSVWREIQIGPSWYMQLALSHAFDFNWGHSLDLGGWVSYMDSERDDYRSFHDGTVYTNYNVPLNDFFTVSATVNYTFPLSSSAKKVMQEASFDGDDSQFVYGGLSLDINF